MAKQRIKEEVGSMEQDPAWPGNGEIRTPGRSIYLEMKLLRLAEHSHLSNINFL